jgi:two-component system, OmpR family, sensor histidine kinase MtrB
MVVTLHRTIAVVTATISAVAATVAIVLIVLTSALNEVNSRLGTAVERVRLLMELESGALQDDRQARAMLAALSRLQHGEDDQFNRQVQALAEEMALIDDAATPAARDARKTLALNKLRDAVVRENDEARRATTQAASWRRLANVVALAGIAVLVVGFVAPLVWIQRRTLHPLVAITNAIERFAVGDHSARAPQIGPAEFRRVAAAFNGMAVALQHQYERQLAFVGGVAHDLRNPLSTLKLVGTLLQRQPENTKQVGDRIMRQVEQLERLVNDLLDRTRIESGHLDLHADFHDLRDVVASVIDEQRTLAPTRTFRMIRPDRPVVVRCDVIRIEQVLRNLLSNAVKYSADPTEIVLRLGFGEAQATVSVADAGIGVSESDRERLFQPFVRGENVGTVGGLGLGLSVSRKIVEGHGGQIAVHSTLGEGSTFVVRLPLATAGAVPGAAARLDDEHETVDAEVVS